MGAVEGNYFRPSEGATREQAISAANRIWSIEEAYDAQFE